MIREAIIGRVTVRGFCKVRDSDAIAKLVFTARIYSLGVLTALECLENRQGKPQHKAFITK
ncbi:MAG: hypothetical protein J7J78_03030 [Thermoprotei archaeon]|nr:hypothetical protein [Thermoprotei archaeon]